MTQPVTLTEAEQDALACRCPDLNCPLHSEAADGYIEHEATDLLETVQQIKAAAIDATRAEMKSAVEQRFPNVSLDDLFTTMGWI